MDACTDGRADGWTCRYIHVHVHVFCVLFSLQAITYLHCTTRLKGTEEVLETDVLEIAGVSDAHVYTHIYTGSKVARVLRCSSLPTKKKTQTLWSFV